MCSVIFPASSETEYITAYSPTVNNIVSRILTVISSVISPSISSLAVNPKSNRSKSVFTLIDTSSGIFPKTGATTSSSSIDSVRHPNRNAIKNRPTNILIACIKIIFIFLPPKFCQYSFCTILLSSY